MLASGQYYILFSIAAALERKNNIWLKKLSAFICKQNTFINSSYTCNTTDSFKWLMMQLDDKKVLGPSALRRGTRVTLRGLTGQRRAAASSCRQQE